MCIVATATSPFGHRIPCAAAQPADCTAIRMLALEASYKPSYTATGNDMFGTIPPAPALAAGPLSVYI